MGKQAKNDAYLAQSVEQSAVNRSVVGSSPSVGATRIGPLEKWLNSYAFHAYTHGFESRTGHQLKNYPNQITELSEVRFFYAFFVL